MLDNKDASLTVEAALVIPVFVYTIIFFLYFINIIFIQENIQFGITEVGKFVAKYAYVYNYVKQYDGEDSSKDRKESLKDKEDSLEDKEKPLEDKDTIVDYLVEGSINSLFFKNKMKDFIDETIINNSCITNGFGGLSFINSRFMKEDDRVDIVVTYKIKLPLVFFKIKDISMVQRVNVRGWIGYKPDEASDLGGGDESDENTDNEYVYIAETGSVYHLTNECTHLKLSISEESLLGIDGLRNDGGGKYKECEICFKAIDISELGSVYITQTGDRYHSSIACSGLKRNISKVLLSQVGDRSLCSRCKSNANK